MIDVHHESLLTITAAAKYIPTRPSIPTVWRWLTHGVRGRKLESTNIGGRRYTSKEAIDRFLAPAAERRQKTVNSAAHEQAEREAERMGI